MTSIHIDSHANMVFVFKHATIINQSGKSADVMPFLSDCSKLEAVPINDAVVAYDCYHTLETFILVVQNGLYVHSMTVREERMRRVIAEKEGQVTPVPP